MKPFRAIAVAVFSAQLTLAHVVLVETAAHANLFKGRLRQGETQYLEIRLEPGKYVNYVVTDFGETSFVMYETNGKLIGKSRRFSDDPEDKEQGITVEIYRPLIVHLWVRMDTCNISACPFLFPSWAKYDPNRPGKTQRVEIPYRVLDSRPVYNSGNSGTSEDMTGKTNPPRQGGTSPSNQYVFNTNSYVNTNLSVNPGDKIRVEASGTVRFGAFVGSGGPRGIVISPQYNYFTNVPHGQLIGRIKQSGATDLEGWFPIAEGREFVARSPGVLEFAVNDNRPRDNSGSFRIQVTIEPAK
jgi:hypothetical protein